MALHNRQEDHHRRYHSSLFTFKDSSEPFKAICHILVLEQNLFYISWGGGGGGELVFGLILKKENYEKGNLYEKHWIARESFSSSKHFLDRAFPK